MDLGGKPAYEQRNCPACSGYKSGHCQKCDRKLPRYMSDSGSELPVMVKTGFKSPQVDHWHLTAVEGVPAYAAVSLTLCRECYFKAYSEEYPARKMTIDELPKEVLLG